MQNLLAAFFVLKPTPINLMKVPLPLLASNSVVAKLRSLSSFLNFFLSTFQPLLAPFTVLYEARWTPYLPVLIVLSELTFLAPFDNGLETDNASKRFIIASNLTIKASTSGLPELGIPVLEYLTVGIFIFFGKLVLSLGERSTFADIFFVLSFPRFTETSCFCDFVLANSLTLRT